MRNYCMHSTEALLSEFRIYASHLTDETDPWVIYLRCNSIRHIWIELQKRGVESPWGEVRGTLGKPVGQKVVPSDYCNFHSKDCGTKFRGCAPDCPKDIYERTGRWIGPTVYPDMDAE